MNINLSEVSMLWYAEHIITTSWTKISVFCLWWLSAIGVIAECLIVFIFKCFFGEHFGSMCHVWTSLRVTYPPENACRVSLFSNERRVVFHQCHFSSQQNACLTFSPLVLKNLPFGWKQSWLLCTALQLCSKCLKHQDLAGVVICRDAHKFFRH